MKCGRSRHEWQTHKICSPELSARAEQIMKPQSTSRGEGHWSRCRREGSEECRQLASSSKGGTTRCRRKAGGGGSDGSDGIEEDAKGDARRTGDLLTRRLLSGRVMAAVQSLQRALPTSGGPPTVWKR